MKHCISCGKKGVRWPKYEPERDTISGKTRQQLYEEAGLGPDRGEGIESGEDVPGPNYLPDPDLDPDEGEDS